MDQLFLGQIQLFGFLYAPQGWAKCEGQMLPIREHESLFALLGDTYGGDGRTTFALPDLRDENSTTQTPCIAIQGLWPRRS